jgi:hypothetical protein
VELRGQKSKLFEQDLLNRINLKQILKNVICTGGFCNHPGRRDSQVNRHSKTNFYQDILNKIVNQINIPVIPYPDYCQAI